jgi:ligand-binding SRPBCC domain-containing protein
MRHFRYSFSVNSEITRVWDFYTDMRHLEVITPPQLHLRVLKTTHQKLVEGSEVWLTGKLVWQSTWHSRITSLAPYEYVDEMLTGRFKVWKHVHAFRKNGEKETEVIDEIDFELPYGPLGRLFGPFVVRQLKSTFEHRKIATRSELEKD